MGRLDQLNTKHNYITADTVLHQTDGGLDVFRAEIPDFTTTSNVLNIFTNEKNPSARIKQSSSSGLWYFKIYNAEGGCYNAIQFIQKRYNLGFKEAIDYITQGMKLQPVIEHKPITIRKKEPIYYEVETQPFTKEHTNYYCIGGITEDFLNKEMDIYAVKRWALGKKVREPKEGTFMFVYIFRDEFGDIVPGKMKFLTLGKNITKKDKWRNSNNPTKCYYEYKITKETKQIFVVKSNKDCGPLAALGITAIATMSENYFNIKEALERLIKKYPHVEFILNLGSDFQGSVETSIPLSKEFGLRWFNIPKRFLTNDINDNFSYTQAFGIKSFKQLLKNKKYL